MHMKKEIRKLDEHFHSVMGVEWNDYEKHEPVRNDGSGISGADPPNIK